MAIFTTRAAGPGEAAGPMYQAEAELGSAPGEPAVTPPPKTNGTGNGASRAAAEKSPEADAAGIDVADSVETGPAAAEPEGAAASRAGPQPGDQAPNPLASAIALMTVSAPHRHLFISDLEWALLPPIALRQCRVFVKDGRPVGFASWAFVSDEVDARLRTGQTKLKPAEWKSGDRCWLIDLIAPFGGAPEFVKTLTNGVLKEHRPSLSALVQFTVKATERKVEGDKLAAD